MKKTDKIELRVDHAEKERLSSIAERRGQTVSDVVRDALAGELGTPRPNYPKWPGRVAIGAMTASLIAVVISLTPQPNTTHTTYAYPKTISVDLKVSPPLFTYDEMRMDIDMVANAASEKEIALRDVKGNLHNISLKMTPDPNNTLMNITIAVCTMVEDQCLPADQTHLSIDTNPTLSSSASAMIRLKNGGLLETDFRTLTHRFEPKPIATSQG